MFEAEDRIWLGKWKSRFMRCTKPSKNDVLKDVLKRVKDVLNCSILICNRL